MSVVTLRNRLTETDIRRLVRGRDEEDRALAARKVCQLIDTAKLTDVERSAVNGILDMIVQDAAEMVRRSMAVTLRQSKNLPREIAIKLAADVDSVATPVLLSSPSFEAADLEELVRASESSKRCAIAARESLPAGVVHEIIETGDDKATGIAASNNGAEFDAEAYEKAFAAFCENPDVMDSFVARTHLPVEITEKLVAHVSQEAAERLVRNHALPPQLAIELAEGARERATIDLVDQAGVAQDPEAFVKHLRMSGRLTPSLILRAVLRGHIVFLEHAFAELAGVTHGRAWLLVHDAGPLGLRAVYDRTGMPPRLYPAIRAVLDVYHSMEMPQDEASQEHFRRVLAERAITRFQGIPEDDLDYVMSRFDSDAPMKMAG